MTLHDIEKKIVDSDPFRSLGTLVDTLTPERPVTLTGISGSLLAIVASFLFTRGQRQVLLVAPDRDSAEKLHDDCVTLLGDDKVALSVYRAHHAAEYLDANAPVAQVETLNALREQRTVLVIASAEGAAAHVPTPESFLNCLLHIREGEIVPFENIVGRLSEMGFERKEFVEGIGDFAVRGGILDIFSYVGDHPIRVEFWGDTVESIREFDPLSQRSIRSLQTASIAANIYQDGKDGPDSYSTLIEYLSADALILVHDPLLLQKELDELHREGVERIQEWNDFEKALQPFRRIIHAPLSGTADRASIDFLARPQPALKGSTKLLLAEVSKLSAERFLVVLGCDTPEESNRVRELLDEEAEAAESSGDRRLLNGAAYELLSQTLHNGFVYPPALVGFFTEHEVFGRLKRRGRTRRTAFKGFSQKDLQQLRRGDFVVHQDYGIGRFGGLQKIRVKGAEQEVLKLLYEDDDVVYVNLNFVQRVQKYSSKEGHVPKLSKLGTPQWERLKARAKKRIKDIARELITLYARRKHEPGHQFSPDTHWQKELEASFMYEDTPDQATATTDVKKDMEASFPMDRLICGDVGFGKTEVALRAAFKAVLDGKQVAVLVPTTILAQQHYNTFLDRVGRYPVRIAHLSRFKSKKEQTAVSEQLGAGTLDILIGTHRILSKDITFKNLGLLVIDEEHRFGVSAKEKLRQLRASVDTLTLTATPIPRTLHFSLMGARDLSLINTPPRNRLPIITEIATFDLRLVREAVLRELHRGGQVYFIHDRVHNIDDIHSLLAEHIPEARFHTAHGQMPGHELEKTMMSFLERKYDVLICTKIIESGIDIPSVNTIIINRADRFGLAELYQLRGRVGRSNVQAYAFLLTPPLSSLPRVTLRRLQAIQEFTELGSGFNLAMRDLEIRGAGNLLGAEQSGFIMEMGFETYQRIVEEAVGELKEQEFADLSKEPTPADRRKRVETVIETDVEALIPDVYVESDAERLDLYRRLYRIETGKKLEEMRTELRDRFGNYPDEVEYLFASVELKIVAAERGFTRVHLDENRLTLTLPPSDLGWFYEEKDGETSPFQLMMERLSALQGNKPKIDQTGKTLTVWFTLKSGELPQNRLSECRQILEEFPRLEETPLQSES